MDMDFDDLEMDVPEEADERQNRGFIILVAAMSGMLLIGIIAFCAWVVIVGRGYLGGAATTADTPTPPVVTEVAGTEEATLEATPTESVEPTPTSRPAPTATRTPTPIVTMTASPVPVETPTTRTAATFTVTATPPADSSTPETGIGAFAAIGAALGLVALLALVRRLRAAH
jgi:cytoskeletal protein RodZ